MKSLPSLRSESIANVCLWQCLIFCTCLPWVWLKHHNSVNRRGSTYLRPYSVYKLEYVCTYFVRKALKKVVILSYYLVFSRQHVNNSLLWLKYSVIQDMVCYFLISSYLNFIKDITLIFSYFFKLHTISE